MHNQSITSRREFLALGLALSSGLVAKAAHAGESIIPMPANDLIELTATEALKALREGALSAEAYAGALLERCEATKHLNAFISLNPQYLLEQARAGDLRRESGAQLGLLHGLPIPIKDSINTEAFPTTGGTSALRGFRPQQDAKLVQQLVDAGAMVMGKTNIHELSFGWTSNNLQFGAVHNPYDIDRIPGGSSGGTAVAIAARMAPLGIAEDTQGSIRVPAALCGICGFRPTTGRYPNQGVIPITALFDQVGPHARSVEDLSVFDSVICAEPPAENLTSLKGIRLGVAKQYYFDSLDAEIETVTQKALDKLTDAGVVLVEVEVPDLTRLISLTTAAIQLHDVMPSLIEYLQRYETGIDFDQLMAQASADIQQTFQLFVLPGATFKTSEETYVAARDVHLPKLRRTFHDYFRSNNLAALIFPTTQITAPAIGQDREVELNAEMTGFQAVISRNISPGSTAGLPGLVMPTGLNRSGLPISIELDGPQGSDRALLSLGREIQKVLGVLPAPTGA